MKLFAKSVLLVGVTLCVAPIFSVVHAQQGSNDARMLLQMQEMQAEIAVLRDMVERQQYQLQRMQRKIQDAEQTGIRPNAVIPSAVEQPTIVGSVPQTSGSFPDPASDIDNETLTDDEKWLVSRSTQTEVNTSEQTTEGTFSENVGDEDYYQAPRPNDRRLGSANDVNTVVEEREITAPPLPQTATGSNYPPVEDRSIGAVASRTAQSPPTTQRAAQIDPRPRALPLPTQTPADAINAQQLPTKPVIAIPGSRLPNSNPRATSATVQALEPATNPSALPEQEYYQQGIALVKQSKFNDAIQMFQQLIDNYPKGSLTADAYYWIGEAGFLDRDLATSKQYFRTFMDSYPQSARIPSAMLRTAYIEQEQGNVIEARILLNEIIQYHPSSDAVHAAKNRLADLESKSN